jgi:hypothetical protein
MSQQQPTNIKQLTSVRNQPAGNGLMKDECVTTRVPAKHHSLGGGIFCKCGKPAVAIMRRVYDGKPIYCVCHEHVV